MNSVAEGLQMLDLFTSVGADAFHVTKTNVLDEKLLSWAATPERLRETLPAIFRIAAGRKPCRCRAADGTAIMAGENVIVRPMSRTTSFIQLDDLPAERLEQVRPVAFLILATSPGNHQAWIAVSDLKQTHGDEAKEFVRRVKKGKSDKSASGAVRLAGSENFKLKYHPNFPRVTILEAAPGRTVTADQLERLGLVAPPEPSKEPLSPFRASRPSRRRVLPSYQRCLDGAPPASKHQGPDRSQADFVYCMTAIDWGFSTEEAAEGLLQESPRARERGRDYALVTARNAYTQVEKNRAGQGRSRA